MYEEKFMKEAVALSEQCLSLEQGGPFGAVVVKDGKIVGRGRNMVTVNNDPTAHAEVMAIRNACKNLNTFQLTECDIYSSCEPCPMCLGAIYWARPKHLYFAADREQASLAGFDDSFIYHELTLPYSERKIPTERHLYSDAGLVLENWKHNERKIEY